MLTFPQPLLIAFCLLIPVYCLVRKKHDFLIGWLTLVTVIDIFNSQKYMNLTAIKLAGITLIPYVLINLKTLIKLKEIKLLLIHFALLCILGLVYGHIIPWEDLTGLKGGRDIPQWRSIIHLGSIFLEWNVVFYLSMQFVKIERFYRTVNIILIALTVNCIFGFVESYFKIDFYHFFTEGYHMLVKNRMRGLSYEPRGLAQICVFGISLTLGTLHLRKWYINLGILLLLGISTFVFNISVSAIVILAACIGFLIAYKLIANLKLIKKYLNYKRVIIALVAVFVSIFIIGTYVKSNKLLMEHLEKRSYILKGKGIAQKLEVFDAAAMNFLLNNPKHLILGAGPGLISVPASSYILERDKEDWTHIVALPHLGLILQLANGGLIGLAIFLAMLYISIKNIKNKDIFIFVGITFVFYLLQIRPIFFIGLALAIGNSYQRLMRSE